MRLPHLLPAALLLALAASAAPPDDRIARVENGLRPANILKSSPAQPMKLADRMKFYQVPAVSIAVIHEGRLAWARAYGQRDTATGEPATPETLFQAASLSKGVAATVALRLVEQRRLTLDEDVNAKLKSWQVPENDFTRTEKVTLRRLLNHAAGLTVHGFPGYAQGAAIPTLPQLLDGKPPANTAPVRVTATPGTLARYSGGGYEVMQLLLEDVTGQDFETLARTLILDPLGMKRSTFRQPLPADRAANAAHAYRAKAVAIPGRWHSYPEQTAAGLWTTPSELALWILELQKPGRALTPASVQAMLAEGLGNYGLGAALSNTNGRPGFAHGGSNAGFRCQYFAYRDSGDAAIVMTNSDNGSALANEILRAIAVEYHWADYLPKERAAVPVDPAILAAYVGDYEFPGGPTVQVRLQDGHLTTNVGRGASILTPSAQDSFFDLEDQTPPIRFRKASNDQWHLEAQGRIATRKQP